MARQDGEQQEMMYTVEAVSELFLQLSHAAPLLTAQWLYILILLNWCPQDFWASVLTTPQQKKRQEEAEIGFHREMLRRARLVLYCDFLCDHTSHVEGTTWLVMSHAHDVVRGFAAESPVQDFVMSMHSSSSSSSLLLQAVVTSCGEEGRRARGGAPVIFLKQALQVRSLNMQVYGRLKAI